MNMHTSSKMVALYIRLSLEDNKNTGNSIENQKALIHQYLDGATTAYAKESVVEFVDNGYSGRNFERPAINELLEAVRLRQVSTIVVKDFSRLGRDLLHTGYLLEKVFPLYDIRFISVSDNYDSQIQSGVGNLEYTFRYLNHEYYSRDLSKKVKSSKHMKMKEGRYISENALYGYRRADDQLVIDGAAAEVVQLIFRLRAEGMTYTGIQKVLLEQNVPTPSEHKFLSGQNYHKVVEVKCIWHVSVIQSIIADERYTGVYISGVHKRDEVSGKRYMEENQSKWYIVEGALPQIISKELYHLLKEQREHTKRIAIAPQENGLTKTQRRYSAKKEKYPLSNYVVCGVCNKKMSLFTKDKVFKCKDIALPKEDGCQEMKIASDRLHAEVWERIQQLAVELKIRWIASEQSNRVGTSGEQRFHAEQKKLFEQMVSGAITEKEFQEQNLEVESACLRNKEMTEDIKNSEIQLASVGLCGVQMKELIEQIEGSECITRELVVSLIDKVMIDRENNIDVKFKETLIF